MVPHKQYLDYLIFCVLGGGVFFFLKKILALDMQEKINWLKRGFKKNNLASKIRKINNLALPPK